MNWLRLLILMLGIVHSQLTGAQCRILYRSNELAIKSDQNRVIDADTSDQITSIESRGVLSNYLIVRYVHARRKLILKKSIWGFIDSRRVVWRSYKKELFLVLKYNANWVEYAIERPIGTRLTPTYAAIMYSRTLDSKIKLTWADAMKDVPPGFILH